MKERAQRLALFSAIEAEQLSGAVKYQRGACNQSLVASRQMHTIQSSMQLS